MINLRESERNVFVTLSIGNTRVSPLRGFVSRYNCESVGFCLLYEIEVVMFGKPWKLEL